MYSIIRQDLDLINKILYSLNVHSSLISRSQLHGNTYNRVAQCVKTQTWTQNAKTRPLNPNMRVKRSHSSHHPHGNRTSHMHTRYEISRRSETTRRAHAEEEHTVSRLIVSNRP
jgi:hypothetical protein